MHGRSYSQRYSREADWDYLKSLADLCTPNGPQVIGTGDIYTYQQYYDHLAAAPNMSAIMTARGALIKPWLFTEIKERRHWDISSTERWDLMSNFVKYGLDYWGSDSKVCNLYIYILYILGS